MVRKTRVQFQVESYQKLKKWYLMPPCLTFSIIRVKWSNLGKGVALSATPQSSNYWKGSFRVFLDKVHQLYFLTFNNIMIQTITAVAFRTNNILCYSASSYDTHFVLLGPSSLFSLFHLFFSTLHCFVGWTAWPDFYVHITWLLRRRRYAFITSFAKSGNKRCKSDNCDHGGLFAG